jgi:hypothetical protein
MMFCWHDLQGEIGLAFFLGVEGGDTRWVACLCPIFRGPYIMFFGTDEMGEILT